MPQVDALQTRIAELTSQLRETRERLARSERELSDARLPRVNPVAVRTFREKRGETLRQVADRAYVSHTYLVHIESGKRAPRTGVIARLAEALDVPVAAITCGGES